jgi:hypothetical protein
MEKSESTRPGTSSACGESHLTAETLHAIDGIRARRESLAESRTVDVIRFDAA